MHGMYTAWVSNFYGKWPHPLLWTGLQVACGKLTVSGIHKCLDYCVIFIAYAQFTNVVTGRIIQPDRPKVGDP